MFDHEKGTGDRAREVSVFRPVWASPAGRVGSRPDYSGSGVCPGRSAGFVALAHAASAAASALSSALFP
jgi:hypothetical protein